jgi:hypothetical protein
MCRPKSHPMPHSAFQTERFVMATRSSVWWNSRSSIGLQSGHGWRSPGIEAVLVIVRQSYRYCLPNWNQREAVTHCFYRRRSPAGFGIPEGDYQVARLYGRMLRLVRRVHCRPGPESSWVRTRRSADEPQWPRGVAVAAQIRQLTVDRAHLGTDRLRRLSPTGKRAKDCRITLRSLRADDDGGRRTCRKPQPQNDTGPGQAEGLARAEPTAGCAWARTFILFMLGPRSYLARPRSISSTSSSAPYTFRSASTIALECTLTARASSSV